MATTTMYAATGAAARPRLMSRAFVLVLLAGVGSSTSFYLLFSALPRYTDAIGAGGVGAGLTTGVMMLATVAAEFAVPRLTARFGYRAVFGTGLVLLGAPALVLAAAGSMPMVLAACLVRGAGFAVAVVLGGALVASIVPAERRGEGLGVHGVACGTPAVASLPLGLWLGERAGYATVFALAGVSALAGLAAVRDLPGRRRPGPDERPLGIASAARRRDLRAPALVFAATTVATGITATFLPLAGGGISAWALLAHSLAATSTRWWAGRDGDRYGAARQLGPGLVIAASGIALLVAVSNPVAVTLGATGFGLLAVRTGYPAAFGLTAALMLLPLLAGTGARTRRTCTA